MILGFTGTRSGMTDAQKAAFESLLLKCSGVAQFHHGDCIGADAEAHDIVRRVLPLAVIYVHPATVRSSLRAKKVGDVLRVAKPPLDRNRDIVKECDLLFACPAEKREQLRSGTWSTVRKARECMRPSIVIDPDGGVACEGRMRWA